LLETYHHVQMALPSPISGLDQRAGLERAGLASVGYILPQCSDPAFITVTGHYKTTSAKESDVAKYSNV
jgi:hypothetical protein